MKVLFLNTSEEENGLLSKGIALCCAKLAEAEIEYDVRWVKDVHPCTSCGKCLKRRRCLFDGIINLSWLLKCISSGKEHGIQNPCFVEKLDAFMLGR